MEGTFLKSEALSIFSPVTCSANNSTLTHYLTNAQGSVLTTLSASAIVGQQVYGPYGNTRYQIGSMGTAKGYTRQVHDTVSGLDYYHARYYDPVIGQFLSVDNVPGTAYFLINLDTREEKYGRKNVA